jgi:type IV pilus assembly protein PilQ
MNKTRYLIALAGLASVLVAHAQSNPFWPERWPAGQTNAAATNATVKTVPSTNSLPAPSVAPAPVTATVVTTNTVTVSTANNSMATNQPAAATVTVTNVTAMNVAPVTQTAKATNSPTATATNSAPVATAEPAPSEPAGPPVIPLIQFSDVPLTTAIENLARQANINYMLDPKIGYGQPDQTGQVKTEPVLSIRWENITAANALSALLDNYGLQLTRDKSTGIARVTMKDPTAPPPLITRVVQLQYASVSNLVTSIQSTLVDKRSRVIADNRTSQLIVVATEPEQEAVDTLVAQLDKATKQVLIETKLVELSSNPTSAKGIDWTATLGAQHFAFGNNVNGGAFGQPYSQTYNSNNNTTTYGINNLLQEPGLLVDTAKGMDPQYAFLNADGVSAVLSFLNSEADAQVVSTPRVVTLDNETADISVTRSYPIINVTASTANTTGGSSITYSNIGTILEVTPHISANDRIMLRVTPDVSSFFGTVSKTVGGVIYQADEFDTRHFDTQVLIPNGNTLVMGGLVQDNPNASYTKVPILGDIPGLGYAFRYENNSLSKENLLVFITPTVVRDADFTPAPSDFLQSKPREMKAPVNPHSWWDSAQPQGNWSDPMDTSKDNLNTE